MKNQRARPFFDLLRQGGTVMGVVFLAVLGLVPASGTEKPVLPVIETQPQSVAVEPGMSAKMSVTASGQSLSYRWHLNGSPLPDQTASSIRIRNASSADEGIYTVVVSNPFGAVTSAPATLVVGSAPVITSQPQDQSVAPGTDLVFTASVRGSPSLQYQWALNGDYIVGATGPTLTLLNVAPADGGDYSFVVFDAAGIVASEVATLVVTAPPLPFADAYANRGAIAGLSGTGSGSNVSATRELTGEPRHAGMKSKKSVWLSWVPPAKGIATINTDGSNFDTVLAVYKVSPNGTYHEVVSDDDSGGYHTSRVRFNAEPVEAYAIAVSGVDKEAGNIVLHWELLPTEEELPVITSAPKSVTVEAGQGATLSVRYETPGQIDAQWYKNGVLLAGATGNDLDLGRVWIEDVGQYTVRLSKAGQELYTAPPAEVQINSEGLRVVAHNKLSQSVPGGLGAPARAGLQTSTFAGYSGTQIFSTTPGKDADEPNHCGIVGGASYWFSWRAPARGLMSLWTDGSTFDTILAVYRDDGLDNGYASLMLVDCDNNSGLDGLDSALQFDAASGTTYYIVVDGVHGATGLVFLNYFLDACPTLTTVLNRTTPEDTATPALAFTVNDGVTPPLLLGVTAAASNPTLFPAGSLTLGGIGENRTITARPAANKHGTATITLTVTDWGGCATSTSFTVTVTPVNDAPVANSNTGTRYPNSTIRFAIAGLLRNDSDVDGDALTLSGFSSRTSNGATIKRSTDYLVYTPPTGLFANSLDSFTYTISDGHGGTATGIVYVYVGVTGATGTVN